MTVRDESQRPVQRVVDRVAGTVVDTPVTDAEWDELDAHVASAAAAAESQAAADASLRAAVAAHPDPVVQALAQRAGLV